MEHLCQPLTVMTCEKKRYAEGVTRSARIAAVRRGERKKDVSQMWLNISRNTLDLWLKREEKTGDCRAVTNYQHQQGGGQKIADWERFGDFAREHGGKTQGEMAKLWGDNVTPQNLSDALAKIRWSRKKRLTGIENEMNLSAKYFNNN